MRSFEAQEHRFINAAVLYMQLGMKSESRRLRGGPLLQEEGQPCASISDLVPRTVLDIPFAPSLIRTACMGPA